MTKKRFRGAVVVGAFALSIGLVGATPVLANDRGSGGTKPPLVVTLCAANRGSNPTTWTTKTITVKSLGDLVTLVVYVLQPKSIVPPFNVFGYQYPGKGDQTILANGCVAGPPSVFCPSTGCTLGPVPVGPPGSTVTVLVPPCPTLGGCVGTLTVSGVSLDPTTPTPNTMCPDGDGGTDFNAVSAVTISPPSGHTDSDPPITVTFSDTVSVTGYVCKTDSSGDFHLLNNCEGPPWPCILSEDLPDGEGTSTIVVAMTSVDPIVRH
jgi:hypothetical protein